MTLTASEETVPDTEGKGAAYNVNPSTDEQIAHYERTIGSFVMTAQSYDHVILSLIARIRSERDRTIREFADILRKDFLQREDAFWAAYIVEDVALSLSQVSAKK